MQYKPIHLAVARRAEVEWTNKGTTANVYFYAEDDAAVVLTMPRQALVQLRADIADALAHKPQPNPNR